LTPVFLKLNRAENETNFSAAISIPRLSYIFPKYGLSETPGGRKARLEARQYRPGDKHPALGEGL
jgi:hypothetical protein